jgi:hypothetical protein
MSHAIKNDHYAIANGPLAIDLVDGLARMLPVVLIDLIIGCLLQTVAAIMSASGNMRPGTTLITVEGSELVFK